MQINRLFEIVYILLEKKQVTAEELAKRFEVSTRTIYRDIEVLSASRIPIYMTRGKNGGISILSDFTLDKTVLTQKEKSDIIASLKVIESVNITDDNTALNKLSAMLGDVNTDWIEINFSSWNNDNSQQETFSLLKKAILERKEVEFIYSSTKLEETKRTVKPLKLVYKGASWYLYGHCTLRDDYRFFKLRRLKNLIITNRRFFEETPKKISNINFTNNNNHIMAKILIDKKLAYRVYDEAYSYSKDENGNFICEIAIENVDMLASYVSTFGEYAKILEPKFAVKELKEKLKNIAKIYDMNIDESK